MMKRKLIFILLLSLILVACDNNTKTNDEFHKGNPTPEDILSKDTDADIFLLNGIVYKNGEGIDWVQDQQLTIGKEVGKIKIQTTNVEEFENSTATKLSVGTKVYEALENATIYIIKEDEERKYYIGLKEVG